MWKFEIWDFVFCITWSKKYKIVWKWDEKNYEYFSLYNLKTWVTENLLVEFVEKKFHKLHLWFMKKIMFYFIINFKKDDND